MSCGVGHRCGSDLALLWLWCRLAAVAPIRFLAWEPPYAMGVALIRQNKQTNKQKTKKKEERKLQEKMGNLQEKCEILTRLINK